LETKALKSKPEEIAALRKPELGDMLRKNLRVLYLEADTVSMGFCLVPLPRPDVNVRANHTNSAQAD
jgi:hypothetical protein